MSDIDNFDPFAETTNMLSSSFLSEVSEEGENEYEIEYENSEEEIDAFSRSLNAINFDNTYDTYQQLKTHFCCQIDREIHLENSLIQINHAQKTNDNNGSTFITYTINVGEQEVKRRYSEFESLRKSLIRLYPTLIVPPIPEKHSIADYATMQSKAKEDVGTIERRKRMLQRFLNRSPANLSSSQSSTTTNSTNHIPKPSASQPLKNPDPQFVEAEAYTNKFYSHISQNMEKTNKRIWKRLNDFSNDYSELGALYNGFSLSETDDLDLSNAIERVGQAVDSTYMSTGELTTALESEFTEPLTEYSQYAQIIKQVLKYRHLKHLQMEHSAETLEKQKLSLESLERSEQEARRLEDALSHNTQKRSHTQSPRGGYNGD
ncbi:1860_t:CDS:2, partial [Diversispora eburnea]